MKKIFITILLCICLLIGIATHTGERFGSDIAVVPEVVHYLPKRDEELEFWLHPHKEDDIVLD